MSNVVWVDSANWRLPVDKNAQSLRRHRHPCGKSAEVSARRQLHAGQAFAALSCTRSPAIGACAIRSESQGLGRQRQFVFMVTAGS